MRIALLLSVAVLVPGSFEAQASSIVSSYFLEAYTSAGGQQSTTVNSGPSTVPLLEFSQNFPGFETADASLYGSAAADTLHGFVGGSTSVNSSAGFFLGSAAYANLQFNVMDDFFFNSDTLAAGTAVSFLLTASLHSVLATNNAPSVCNANPVLAGNASLQMLYNNGNQYGARIFPVLAHDTCGNGSDQMSFSGVYQSTVGADFAVQTIFTLQSTDGLYEVQPATSSVTVDASNTAAITVQVLTPGVTFSSGSGATYSQPEPGTLFLLAAGLLGLATAIRRKPVDSLPPPECSSEATENRLRRQLRGCLKYLS